MDLAALSFSEIAAAFTVVGTLGGVFIWALATKFATKKLVYLLRDKLEEELRQQIAEALKSAAAAHDEAKRCNSRHDLAAVPFENVVKALEGLKSEISTLNLAAQERNERTLTTLAGIDKRVTVIEDRERSRRKR